MTIHLPVDIEHSIEAIVNSGQFASVDDAMAEAARLLLREWKLGHIKSPAQSLQTPADSLLGSIGAMREDAELLDRIVADAYRQRREESWREIDL